MNEEVNSGCCAICQDKSSLRCARCQSVYYCNREHQRQHWKRHKSDCRKLPKNIEEKEGSITSNVVEQKAKIATSAITYEGSSENEILSASTQPISNTELSDGSYVSANSLKTVEKSELDAKMPTYASEPPTRLGFKEYPEIQSKESQQAAFCHNSFVLDISDPYYELCHRVIRDMNAYGVCVMDNFLGKDRGMLVLNEVLGMYQSGIFQAGQLVSSPSGRTETRTIRGDRITWIDGKEKECFHIGQLIQQVDNIVLRANKMPNNGKMGDYNINGRTKAMVACYPGSGSHYVKHVDNPNKDGRCITAIYYLNLDWDVTQNGGLLRVFPEGYDNQVADIAPVFDRVLFFWSDRRNPHEVQPAFNTRYAITLWYFDAIEREEATRRYREKINTSSTSK